MPGSTGMVTVTGVGSTWTNSGSVILGYHAGNTGTLIIAAGGQVSGTTGGVGDNSGSTGTATVTGIGSKWICSSYLSVGNSGYGTLNIEAGGQVSSVGGSAGYNTSAAGTVTVTGDGSKWLNSGDLRLGWASRSPGTLKVADGGQVTACSVTVNNVSAITLYVNGNGMLVLGNTTTTGSITNNGAITLQAYAFLAPGVYTPISESRGLPIAWTGTGSCSSFGGTWNSPAKTFTVVASTTLAAGAIDTVGNGQRVVFDAGGGRHLGACFATISGSKTFSAAWASQTELNALAAAPGLGGSVRSAWDLTTTNLSGSEALLSFDVGIGAQNLAIWHYTGGAWAAYSADMFTYDSAGVVSFRATDLTGGYAVVGVPEPATLGLLALGALALIRRRQQGL
jgi:T5SS/PEP-CTERM-associated repeat protein